MVTDDAVKAKIKELQRGGIVLGIAISLVISVLMLFFTNVGFVNSAILFAIFCPVVALNLRKNAVTDWIKENEKIDAVKKGLKAE